MEFLPSYILIVAFLADWFFGDPKRLPHLIVGYGRIITIGEKILNKGRQRVLKGALLCLCLVVLSFLLAKIILNTLQQNSIIAYFVLSCLVLFYCLANKTLVVEGRKVFTVLDQQGLEAGRRQVAFIVGRDTSKLSENEVRAAALETVSENLSDGVIAPIFYFAIFGVPGAMAYKMINTLDSMLGYRTQRYAKFGMFSARLDDFANYIPARITALLMLVSQAKLQGLPFVIREAKRHKSPNAGYPEAALAYILNCQFGGPSSYQGQLLDKQFIGNNKRPFFNKDIQQASRVNLFVSIIFIVFSLAISYIKVAYEFI